MEPIEKMRQDGVEKGLCRLYQMKLRDGLSVKELADLYKEGIDFCINNDYPSLDFLREHYRGKCEEYGVYVDDRVAGLQNPKTVVLNGKSEAMIQYKGYTVSRLYLRHDSEATVCISEFAHVTIDCFDNTRLVVATVGSDAQVLLNVYGQAQVKATGDGIKVNYKHKNTI